MYESKYLYSQSLTQFGSKMIKAIKFRNGII